MCKVWIIASAGGVRVVDPAALQPKNRILPSQQATKPKVVKKVATMSKDWRHVAEPAPLQSGGELEKVARPEFSRCDSSGHYRQRCGEANHREQACFETARRRQVQIW